MSVKRYSVGVDGVDPNGSLVKYTDYAALESRCAALAADNAWLIEQSEEVYAAGYNHGHLNTVDGIAYADCVKDDFYGLALELMREAQTPATDAFLAEVRAQGADAVADQHRRMYEELKPINKFFANDHMNAQKVAELVAAQLRQETAQ